MGGRRDTISEWLCWVRASSPARMLALFPDIPGGQDLHDQQGFLSLAAAVSGLWSCLRFSCGLCDHTESYYPFPTRLGHPALLATPGASSINSAAFHKTPFPPGTQLKVHKRPQGQSRSEQLLSMQRQGPHTPETEGWRLWARSVRAGSCVHMGGGWCSFPWFTQT